MIDSRDFLAAKRRVETEPLIPAGPKIAFTGGLDFNDHRLIWDRLDKALARHPNMALLHGGSPKGAERIAACWADNRKTPQIVFKPEWARHGKAAPFKRNDRMLEILPSESSSARARASPPISPTRRRCSASRSGVSGNAARKRRFLRDDRSTRTRPQRIPHFHVHGGCRANHTADFGSSSTPAAFWTRER
jgi:YspA, cpYpsA-related SLOG family